MTQEVTQYIKMMFSTLSRIKLVFWKSAYLNILCIGSEKPWIDVTPTTLIHKIQLLKSYAANKSIELQSFYNKWVRTKVNSLSPNATYDPINNMVDVNSLSHEKHLPPWQILYSLQATNSRTPTTTSTPNTMPAITLPHRQLPASSVVTEKH